MLLLEKTLERAAAELLVGLADFRDEPSLEPGHDAFFQPFQRVRVRGRREHQLPLGVEKLVEEIEELLLRPLFAGGQVDVVEQQRGAAAVARAPPVYAVAVDRADQLIDEPLRRETRHDRTTLLRQLEADRIQQVGLAETTLSNDDQRVVLLARLGDDVARGIERDVVGRPRHVRVERERGRWRGWWSGAFADARRRGFGLRHATWVVKDLVT